MTEKKTFDEIKGNASLLLIGLVAFSLVLTSLNLFYTMNLASVVQNMPTQAVGLQQVSSGTNAGTGASATLSEDDIIAQVAAEVIPTGVPAVYGAELDVSFDSVQDSLNKMAPLDKSITLSGAAQQSYIAIGTSISCEYCCGAQYITTPQGAAACGCDHSQAMRGLAKYLVQNHRNEFSDAEILAELEKWKATYFPKQTIQKAVQLKADSGEINQSVIAGLPDMVGGC